MFSQGLGGRARHHFAVASEDEAIRVATLHFGGKAYAWWIFENFNLNNANTFSYARFLKALMGRFDGKLSAM